ncbi:hypothetical protein SPRG_08007 [Saprolegnia parasitica CBS 223.65]|uniref:Cyclic nucleotide-binding domain-containing protein n=1 Tax=Saprolegnia parasitica (strain CBS 223.65) TaxID=695850 RepID=A0A067C7X0_SAPPC|nr:hypothetical protein SPRG_08007 [Saprolegnia parasitica CBS 223.65]KDO26603.1 hypothetical protein SPRG_08007 [Saprolegnia parasitica CBS 223.65]|eukprot:XP_012202745.1 hypothetical protein SPRG_08007 [Saprolegnia parasitica CBS 223.65]
MNVNSRMGKKAASQRAATQTSMTGNSSMKAKGRKKSIAPPRIRHLAVKKPAQELAEYETGYNNHEIIVTGGGARTHSFKNAPPLESVQGSSIRRSMLKIKAKAQSPKTYVIDPKSARATQWDVFMAFLIAYSGITVPLSVCFPGLQSISGFWPYVDNFVDGCFGIDIVRNFMMGYHDDQDQLVVNHREIAKQYVKTWFLIDFFSTFPLQAVATATNASLGNSSSFASIQLIRIFRVFRILKLTRLVKLRVFFKKAEDRFGFNPGMVRLVRLIMLVLFLSHVMACFFHLLGSPVDPSFSGAQRRRLGLTPTAEYLTYKPNVTWLQDNDLRIESDSVRYMYSLYWVMTTLAGVGFGDVHAVSISERMYATFAMMIGASVFGFVIGSISSLLESMDTRAAAYQMKMMDVKDYIRVHKLPKELRVKLCRYFEHYLQRASLFDESSILSEVSLNLRNEVDSAIRNINAQFVMDMAINIKPLFLLADSVIAKEHTVGREMYFLNSGIVSVCNSTMQGHRVLLDVLSENTYFGEAPLLFYCLRENTYISLTNCEMYTLLKEDFDALLEEYPDTESILTEHYDLRKKNYTDTHATMMQRFSMYDKYKDDPAQLRRVEDLWPHLKISFNGTPLPIEQFPAPILKLLPHFLSPRVSVFNSVFSKKVILDGMKPKYEKAFTQPKRLRALIRPQAPWKLRWDILLGVLIVYNVMSIPFQFAFQGGYMGDMTVDPVVIMLDYMVDSIFGVDIVLNFRTGYLDDESRLVMDAQKIARRYLRFWFWTDVVSTFPIGAVADAMSPSAAQLNATTVSSFQNFKLIRFVRLARLLKLMRLLKLNRSVSSVENVLDLSPAAIRLMKLFVHVCFIAHLSACVFFFIGQLSQQIYGACWIGPALWNAPTLDKYITSLYFSFTTMATVGYGDILPVTPLEVIYVTFYMLLGASIFGYIIGSMSTLVDQMQTKGILAKEKMDRVKEYMKERNLPKPLRVRIRKHFEFYLAQKEISADSDLVHELSDDLRTQLVIHLNKDVVAKIPFFANQDDACISYLMGILSQECFTPGEFVFRGEFGRHMYFLVKGTVEVVINVNTPQELLCKVLSEGSYFGELAMLLNSKRSASIRCKTFGVLYVLSRSGMDHIHSHYPNISNHIMKEIRAKLLKIQKEADAREASSQNIPRFPTKQPTVTEQALLDAYAKVDKIILKLVNFYGDGEKSKHRAIATMVSRLKKFDFDGQSVYDAPKQTETKKSEVARRQFAKAGRKLIINMNAFAVESKRATSETRWMSMPSHADEATGPRARVLIDSLEAAPGPSRSRRVKGPSLTDVVTSN